MRHHRSFIVINGELEEEVSRSIDDLNAGLRGRPKLKTIVKGDLLARFQKLGTNLWPIETSASFLTLLEMYLNNGGGPLPKEKLAGLLESLVPDRKSLSKAECIRIIRAAAIVCSSAIAKFTKRENHWAEFEGGGRFISPLFLISQNEINWEQKDGPHLQNWLQTRCLTLSAACDEAINAQTLCVGDPIADRAVFRVRITLLLGLFSLYGLWRTNRHDRPDEHDTFVEEFVRERSKDLLCG